MDTTHAERLGALTARMAESDAAAAYLVKQLAINALGAGAHDADWLRDWCSARTTKHITDLVVKTAVVPLDVATGPGAAARPDARAFLGAVKHKSLLGVLDPISVEGRVSAAVQVGNASATWAGESASKPLQALGFATADLLPKKLIAQVVVSDELVKLSVPNALNLVQRSLVSAAVAAEATSLLDATAASASRPAGLLNGVSTTTPAANAALDAGNLLAAISSGAPTKPALIGSISTLAKVGVLLSELRQLGVQVIANPAATNRLIALDVDGLVISEDGLEIIIGQPNLQLDDAPADPPTSATIFQSLWQRNLRAIKCERFINWTRRADAIAWTTPA